MARNQPEEIQACQRGTVQKSGQQKARFPAIWAATRDLLSVWKKLSVLTSDDDVDEFEN